LQEFFATEAAFRSILLLFNLLGEFQRAAGLVTYRQPATLRAQVFLCGGPTRSPGPPSGSSSLVSLGRLATADPVAEKSLNVRHLNFAEVASAAYNLNTEKGKNSP
jgi:hypothetical protein